MAAWLTSSQEGDICSVCLDLFDDPVDLLCPIGNHSFCLGCLESLITKKGGKNMVVCPLCYQEQELKGDRSNRYGLKRNQALKASADEKRIKVEAKKEANSESFAQLMKAVEDISLVIEPRNIKLLEEYDLAIGKDGKTNIPDTHMGMIMYGVDKELYSEDSDEYAKLSHWRAILIGPQESPIGAMIYNVLVNVPDDYPREPPKCRFEGPKVAMPAVNEQGEVDLSKLEGADLTKLSSEGMVEKGTGVFFKWKPSLNIIDCLVAIRDNLHIKDIAKKCGGVAGSQYN